VCFESDSVSTTFTFTFTFTFTGRNLEPYSDPSRLR
jgi:hypothetical protein